MAIVLTAGLPARAQDPPAQPDAPASLALTVRVTPANIWKVVGGLRQVMKEGPQSEAGPLLLRDLMGIISAEIGIDRGGRPTTPAAGLRVSSDPLARAIQEGGVEAAKAQWTKERQRVAGEASASGLSLDDAVAGTARAIETHAAKTRQAADAIAIGLTGLKEAWVGPAPRPPSGSGPGGPGAASDDRR
jgi:hypothetical protein